MARRDQSNARKLELLNELTSHRLNIKVKKRALARQIALSAEQIKDTINIPKILRNKIKSDFKNSPSKWFIASTIGGLLISKFLLSSIGSKFNKSSKGGKKSYTSFFLNLLGKAASPLIKSYIIGRAQRYLAQRFLDQQEQISQHDYPPYSDYDIR